MGKEIITSGYIEVQKHRFHQQKSSISIYDKSFDWIIVSNRVPFDKKKKGFQFFIGYKDGKKVRPLCVILLKMIAYRRNFQETKCVSFW